MVYIIIKLSSYIHPRKLLFLTRIRIFFLNFLRSNDQHDLRKGLPTSLPFSECLTASSLLSFDLLKKLDKVLDISIPVCPKFHRFASSLDMSTCQSLYELDDLDISAFSDLYIGIFPIHSCFFLFLSSNLPERGNRWPRPSPPSVNPPCRQRSRSIPLPPLLSLIHI